MKSGLCGMELICRFTHRRIAAKWFMQPHSHPTAIAMIIYFAMDLNCALTLCAFEKITVRAVQGSVATKRVTGACLNGT